MTLTINAAIMIREVNTGYVAQRDRLCVDVFIHVYSVSIIVEGERREKKIRKTIMFVYLFVETFIIVKIILESLYSNSKLLLGPSESHDVSVYINIIYLITL